MKQTLQIGSLLMILVLAFQGHAQPARTTAEKADEYLTASASLHRFSGTVLIAQKGTVLLQKGYGWRNELAKTPNDTGSIYHSLGPSPRRLRGRQCCNYRLRANWP